MLTTKYGNIPLSNTNDLVIADVVPLSLGLKIENDLMYVLIKKNTSIPCIFEKEFETSTPFQKRVDICIYEGESQCIKDNAFLDQFTIDILNPKEKNYLPIKFEIKSNDNLLNVSVNVLGEENSKQISIKRVKRKEEEINEMINKGIEERKREEAFRNDKIENFDDDNFNIFSSNIKIKDSQIDNKTKEKNNHNSKRITNQDNTENETFDQESENYTINNNKNYLNEDKTKKKTINQENRNNTSNNNNIRTNTDNTKKDSEDKKKSSPKRKRTFPSERHNKCCLLF